MKMVLLSLIFTKFNANLTLVNLDLRRDVGLHEFKHKTIIKSLIYITFSMKKSHEHYKTINFLYLKCILEINVVSKYRCDTLNIESGIHCLMVTPLY